MLPIFDVCTNNQIHTQHLLKYILFNNCWLFIRRDHDFANRILLLKAANSRRTCRNTWMLTKGAAKIPHPKLHRSHCCSYLHAKRHHWTSNDEIWRLTTNCWNRRTSMQQNGCTSSLCEWRNCHSKKEHSKLAARMQIRLPKAEDSTKIQKK